MEKATRTRAMDCMPGNMTHAGPRRQLRVVIAFLATAGACRGQTSDPTPIDPARVLLAIHDAAGVAQLVLRERSDGFLVTDGTGKPLAHLGRNAGGLADPGAPDGPWQSRGRGDDLQATGGRGLALRRVDGVLRVGDAQGIPFGRVQKSADGSARAWDAGGGVVAVARREGGRVAVTDRDGAARGFVVGPADVERAAAAFLPDLHPVQRAILLAAP